MSSLAYSNKYISKKLERAQKLPAKQYIDLFLLAIVRHIYTRVCNALDIADQDNDEYCLLLSNFADDTATFISGMDLLREAST